MTIPTSTRTRGLLHATLLAVALAGCGRHDAGDRTSDDDEALPAECGRYETAYLSCGAKLGAYGQGLMARHAAEMRAAFAIPRGGAAGSDARAGEREKDRVRRACAEAERQVTQACR